MSNKYLDCICLDEKWTISYNHKVGSSTMCGSCVEMGVTTPVSYTLLFFSSFTLAVNVQ